MLKNINSTKLAFLLALGDYSDVLNQEEQESLKKVAQDLEIQPKAWSEYTEPILLDTIRANSQLHQFYQSYKDKLDKLETIPPELLPKDLEINQLLSNQAPAMTRGFIPTEPATGYEQQLNNTVIIIGQSENPQETVKKLTSLAQLKQFLNKLSQ